MPKLAILYLQYDTEKYPGSFEKLKSYVDNIPFCNKEYYIIDNKVDKKNKEIVGKKIMKIGGDNSLREFSGWQAGVDFLKSNNVSYNAILFCNDSFLVNGESFLSNHSGRAFLKSILFNALVGKIDALDGDIKIYGYDISQWICTNAFFVPKRMIERLGNIISVDDEGMKKFFSSVYDSKKIFKEDAPISKQYQNSIIEWLTTKWHSRFELNEKNWQKFCKKTQAIFNEALITVRVKKLGFRVMKF